MNHINIYNIKINLFGYMTSSGIIAGINYYLIIPTVSGTPINPVIPDKPSGDSTTTSNDTTTKTTSSNNS